MSRVVSEYEVENLLIDRLESISYNYIELKNYDEVIDNFRTWVCKNIEGQICLRAW